MGNINILKILSKHGGQGSLNGASMQLFFIGDSLTAGTNSSARHSYPKDVMNILSSYNITDAVLGYPGEVAQWYIDNEQASTIEQFRPGSYGVVCCVVWFGANDICYESETAQSIYNTLVNIHGLLRAGGSKTIAVALLNRLDALSQPDTDTKRLAVNAMLAANWQTFCDGYADLSTKPDIYASDAPNNATYFGIPDVSGQSKLHLTDAGYAEVADVVASSIRLILN